MYYVLLFLPTIWSDEKVAFDPKNMEVVYKVGRNGAENDFKKIYFQKLCNIFPHFIYY